MQCKYSSRKDSATEWPTAAAYFTDSCTSPSSESENSNMSSVISFPFPTSISSATSFGDVTVATGCVAGARRPAWFPRRACDRLCDASCRFNASHSRLCVSARFFQTWTSASRLSCRDRKYDKTVRSSLKSFTSGGGGGGGGARARLGMGSPSSRNVPMGELLGGKRGMFQKVNIHSLSSLGSAIFSRKISQADRLAVTRE